MKKLKLMERLSRTLTNADEIFLASGDIQISVKVGLIDNRTRFDFGSNANVVKPFCFIKGLYGYICPDCGEIHFSHNTGKIETGCCLDIDCRRHQYLDGKHYLIQRNPMFLDVEGWDQKIK